MARKEVGPNVICLVIGGNAGPVSPNKGRIVRVLNKHPNPNPHTVWESIWECEPADGKGGFMTKRDNAAQFSTRDSVVPVAAFAEDWLQPLDDDELRKFLETQREKDLDLTH